VFSRFPRSLKVSALTLVAGSAIVVSAATVVQADSGSTQVTYYACVNNSSGTIKMIASSDACAQNEQKIVWNQQGQPGPQGLQGEQGAPGDTGPMGPAGASGASQAYTVRTGAANYVQSAFDQSTLVVASLNLEAGAYVINATETATFHQNFADLGGAVSCSLTPTGAGASQGVGAVNISLQEVNVVVTEGVTLTGPATVSLKCSGPGGLSSESAAITATAVGSVVVQAADVTPVPPTGPVVFYGTATGYFNAPSSTYACVLQLRGENLLPGSTIQGPGPDGDRNGELELAAGTGEPEPSVVVQADGSLAALAQIPSNVMAPITLTATTASGTTVDWTIHTLVNCTGS
jgi:hypothetical protein